MSRFVMLQRRYNDSKRLISDRSRYLAEHAQSLADDFGKWLSLTESGYQDPLCQPIPVKAVAHFLDDDDEPAFSSDLSKGEVDNCLNFALEFRLPGEDSPQLSGTIRLPLSVVRYEGGVKVTVADGGRSFEYSRGRVPELLFDQLYDHCEKALEV